MKMIKMTTTLAIVLLAATPVLAGPFDGTWAKSSAQCSAAYSEDRITISGNRIGFVESTCTLAQPTNLRDMAEAQLFDMQCTGEGMTWSDRTFIGKSGADGLLV